MTRIPDFATIPCRITAGAFSSERTYAFADAEGVEHVGTEQTIRLRSADGSPVPPNGDIPDEGIDGLLAVQVMGRLPSGRYSVNFWDIRDRESAVVDESMIREESTEDADR